MPTTLPPAPAAPRFRIDDPFEIGLRRGWMTGEYVTNRQVAEKYPDWSPEQIETYQNGRHDGVAGDFCRSKRQRAARCEAA